MTEEAYNAALKALLDKRASVPCSRCGFNQFELQPAYTALPLMPDCQAPSSYGPAIPCAVVACKNCGNLSFHSAAHLGLLRPAEPIPPAPGLA